MRAAIGSKVKALRMNDFTAVAVSLARLLVLVKSLVILLIFHQNLLIVQIYALDKSNTND